MCGIAGIVSYDNNDHSENLSRMMSVITHRGPDGHGCERLKTNKENIKPYDTWFGHRRLTIIETSELGRQPMVSNDGKYCITYNGEIYNYLELRKNLENKGYNFKSHSDTEVLLNAYIEYGTEVFDHLIGMYAFAIWDSNNSQICLGRDFMGIKPLYYYVNNNFIAFASEQKAILEIEEVSRKTNPINCYYYLRFGITDHGEDTMFEGIKQLEAGKYAIIKTNSENKTISHHEHWKEKIEKGKYENVSQVISDFKSKFYESISLHLRSDVEVGVALSGGVDSSAIALGVRALYPDRNIHAFSFVANDSLSSEESWIDLIGKKGNLKVHKIVPNPEELRHQFEETIYGEDQPSGDFGIFPQHCVSKLAQDNGIKVLLSGEGGDELFGGYTGYAAARAASLLRSCQLLEYYKFTNKCSKLPGRSNIQMEMLQYLLSPNLQLLLRKLAGKDYFPSWLNKNCLKRYTRTIKPLTHTPGLNKLSKALSLSRNITTLPHLLRYQDRASMSHSVESRVPFVSKPMMEFAVNIPEKYHFDSAGRGKRIVLESLSDILPAELITRKDKKGFDLDRRSWLLTMNKTATDLFDHYNYCNDDLLNINVVTKEWNKTLHGKIPVNSFPWRWMSYIQWLKTFKINGIAE
jgi:asparagine synthase (glutamine-hydrolysing)